LFDRSGDPSTFNKWFADRDIIAIGDEEHLVQLNGAALGRFQTVDFQRLSFNYFILLAACFNYRVNIKPPKLDQTSYSIKY
jgi:hypothetical protein